MSGVSMNDTKRVVICGGRHYIFSQDDIRRLEDVLMYIVLQGLSMEVVTGGAKGADACAVAWARSSSLKVTTFAADWSKHGRAAGPIRNRQMAKYVSSGGICVAFPGGRGTANMVKEAEAVGMEIVDFTCQT